MTKAQWMEHYKAVGTHDYSNCEICKARRKTKRRNESAKAKTDAYKMAGLVKVRGALGGVYWE